LGGSNAAQRRSSFLKGIAIVLVVLGHCFTTVLDTKYYSIRLLKDIIYTFHMPLFFISKPTTDLHMD
jgi:fucose 4-O-acetylase-like acetyltransferase